MSFTLDTFPVLHSERLDLIEIENHHLGDLYTLFSNEEVVKYYNILPLKSEEEAQFEIDYFQNSYKERKGIRWGIALKGQSNIIGTVGFNNYTKKHRSTIGYDLQVAFWNKGYVTEALSRVLQFGFGKLELNRIEAEVMQGNTSSERVLEKLNFTREGILRQWMFWNEKYYDMTMFSLLKSDVKLYD